MRAQVKTVVTAVLVAVSLNARPAPTQPCRGSEGGWDADQLWFIVNGAALMARVDPDLLAAIAGVESDNCVTAVSPAGAAGLMQLMPATADRMGVADRFDPAQSALGAARLLAELEGAAGVPTGLPLAHLLAAYNAGEGAVRHYGGVPPYGETQHYVRSVLMRYLLEPDEGVPEPGAVAAPPAKAPSSDSAVLRELARIRAERGPAGRLNPSNAR